MAIRDRKTGKVVWPPTGATQAACPACGCRDTRRVGTNRVCRNCGCLVGRVAIAPSPEVNPPADTGGFELELESDEADGEEGRGLRCPKCGGGELRQNYTRDAVGERRRCRICSDCGARVYTRETVRFAKDGESAPE